MEQNFSTLNTPIILFGNGECPVHPSVLKIIDKANTFICLDGGVDNLMTLGHTPDYILGDLDSIKQSRDNYGCKVEPLNDQNMTDLEKGLLWCCKNGIEEVSLVGSSGLRDDHSMATLFILLNFASRIRITLLSNYSEIHCIKRTRIFNTMPGQVISIIPVNLDTEITLDGLEYTLADEKLSFPSQGISNIAKNNTCTIKSTDWIWVILNHTK